MSLLDRMRELGLLPEPPPPPPPPPPPAVAAAAVPDLGLCERIANLVLGGDGFVFVTEADHLAMLAEVDLLIFGPQPAEDPVRPDDSSCGQQGAA